MFVNKLVKEGSLSQLMSQEKEIVNQIKKYYDNLNNEKEILEVYTYKDGEKINGFDFIMGFQNYCGKKYNNIKYLGIDIKKENGKPLFYMLFKDIYKEYNTENISNFIKKIIKCCNILDLFIANIFPDKIKKNLFKSVEYLKLTKNKIYILLLTIYYLLKDKITEDIINNTLEISILYNLLLENLSKIDKEEYKIHDKLLENNEKISKYVKENSSYIVKNITKDVMTQLINFLIKNNINDNLHDDKPGRRNKMYEKILMFYYFKQKMPINEIENNSFSIEHIIPHSSEWEKELDINRLGNKIPIPTRLNSKRGNKHISVYNDLDSDYVTCMSKIIPDDKEYNNIVDHSTDNIDKNPYILDNNNYNKFCTNVEKKYVKNIIKCLYKE